MSAPMTFKPALPCLQSPHTTRCETLLLCSNRGRTCVLWHDPARMWRKCQRAVRLRRAATRLRKSLQVTAKPQTGKCGPVLSLQVGVENCSFQAFSEQLYLKRLRHAQSHASLATAATVDARACYGMILRACGARVSALYDHAVRLPGCTKIFRSERTFKHQRTTLPAPTATRTVAGKLSYCYRHAAWLCHSIRCSTTSYHIAKSLSGRCIRRNLHLRRLDGFDMPLNLLLPHLRDQYPSQRMATASIQRLHEGLSVQHRVSDCRL